jgi:molybdopterin molybdotransferase
MPGDSVTDLLSVTEAIAVLDAVPIDPRISEVPLDEALGLVLAETVRADRDYPPFDKSLMDGYALAAASVSSLPATLAVRGTILAGQRFDTPIPPGSAMAIMTGAPLPPGADAIAPVEQTERLGEHAVRVLAAVKPARYIAQRGSDIRADAVILQAGQRLGPAHLAAAATVGAQRLSVHPRPRVAILSTGDELVESGAVPRPEQIRNSNLPMLRALLRTLGCEIASAATVRDDPQAIGRHLAAALANRSLDALLITGGMSMGTHDFVPRLLLEQGVTLPITKLRMKPGKPFVFGLPPAPGPLVFGLPGNPVSAYVCAVRLAARLLQRLRGESPEPHWIDAPIAVALEANGPREFYQPALLRDGQIMPLAWKGSGDLFTLAQAELLLLRGENAPAQPPGASVRALRLPA